jgi:L-ribulokinase
MAAMGGGFDKQYNPNKQRADIYQIRYKKFVELGNYIEHHNKTDG